MWVTLGLLHEVILFVIPWNQNIVLSNVSSLNQEVFKSSPNHNTQSPEVTSKSMASVEEVSDASSKKEAHDSVKRLTEKLSAALVNVSAKEDLVKQHAKVAEEAVAGIAHIYKQSQYRCLVPAL